MVDLLLGCFPETQGSEKDYEGGSIRSSDLVHTVENGTLFKIWRYILDPLPLSLAPVLKIVIL